MPVYTWSCHDCELYWERECKMGKAPEKTKCPGCEKRKGRCYDVPTLKFIGSGFYVNDYGKNNWAHDSQKGSVDEFVEGAKKSSKERMKTGFNNYKVYTPDFDVLEKQGQVTRTNKAAEEAIHDNASRHRKTAEQFYSRAGYDPATQEKTNVDMITKPDKEGLE